MEHFESLVPTIEVTRSVRKIMDFEFSEDTYEMKDGDQYSYWLERWELSESRVYFVIMASCESNPVFLLFL